jgi:hypothetical protein
MDKIYSLIDMLDVLGNDFFFALNKVEKVIYLCSPQLIKKIILNGNPELEYKNLHKICKLKQTLRCKVPEIRSIRNINKILKELMIEKEKKKPFPNPPRIGNDQIMPLSSTIQIREWSKVQHNCISNYVGQVIRGTSYFYKVVNDNEEGTLELKINKANNSLLMGELLAKNNEPVTKETRSLVENWFKNECR